ncbi:MAG: hypothetical protein JWO06_3079 [Bacteroidota bacterium]|nr:hypothetical protein [Bacteroidota bacterium]
MIIIAESGSTKTNWLTENNELYQTIGFNPLFNTSETIFNEMVKHEKLIKLKDEATEIYFYGASCSSPERNKIVSDALTRFFPKAVIIKVDHDLKAAAVATFEGRKGIACILGTGSNSCLYDGTEMIEEVPALGYVLGDEGSGAYFGKKLLALFLYHQLPPATDKLLKEKYHLEKEKIFEMVYKQPFANAYLASFAKAMDESPDKDFMQQFAIEGFTEFFKYHVCCYKNYKLYPVHFVGSIAFSMKDALQKVADNFGCELGVIVREPVYRLLEWHLKAKKQNS